MALFITAGTANKVYELATKEFVYQEVLRKYFPNKKVRVEFEQEAWLYMLEHPEKIIDVWNKKFFIYYFISMVKNQVLSNSSSWHIKFRKTQYQLVEILPEESEEQNPFQNEEEQEKINIKLKKIQLVEEALQHFMRIEPRHKPSIDMFRLYYYENLSIRDISKKFFNTSITTCWEHVEEAKVLVKWYIKKYYPRLNFDL